MATESAHSPTWWDESFEITPTDIEYLSNILLEREVPLSTDELAFLLVRYRLSMASGDLDQPDATPAKRYQPGSGYELGDRVTFTFMGNRVGQVVDSRAGDNDDYGSYQVVVVEFDNGDHQEFAAELEIDHALNVPEAAEQPSASPALSPEEIFIDHGGRIGELLESFLAGRDDLVQLGVRWFPKALMLDINERHLNLAEAILDISGGGPMSTAEIMEQVGILGDAQTELAEFSLNYGLKSDQRFDEVGPAGQVMWHLVRMQPADVKEPPGPLRYTALEFDHDVLTVELQRIESEIEDELTTHLLPRREDSIRVTLIYPHWRSGTLPLTPPLQLLFPTAEQSPRIHFTLVDAESEEEMEAWVVRHEGYIYGLRDWYAANEIPVGGYVTVQRGEDPGRVVIDFGRRGRSYREWLLTAKVSKDRIRFENEQHAVGSDYDDLMAIHVEEPDTLDSLAERLVQNRVALPQIVRDVVGELARLNPQGQVHAKTLYSAVNLVRRAPPGPIMAMLVEDPAFESVGGAYWRPTQN
ncbi:MAG: hypothetical protein GYB68_12405 [Chloroflexi bacterium]|nr:hypothetical protein [Chloroflexota bacterium]